ncbi:MAG: discoidin domain-containing protein [Candidatus Nealsonbacteria bacterium]|nr:discoidin domain-containing protein [Candidatus Nealsonbacteria bacterium]
MRWCPRIVFGCVLLTIAAGTSDRAMAQPPAVDVPKQMQALVEADWIARDRSFSPGKRVAAAPSKSPTVTTAEDSAGGCDGIRNGLWGFHVASGENEPWWQVDLGKKMRLDRVVVYNRCDGGSGARTKNIRVLIAADLDAVNAGKFEAVYQHNGTTFGGATGKPLVVGFKDKKVSARVVRLHIPGKCSFALDEVEVYAADDPKTNVALGKPADQISTSPHSRRGTMSDADYAAVGFSPRGKPATPTAGKGDFSLAHTRAVIERGNRLVERLGAMAIGDRLQPLAGELAKLKRRLAAMEKTGNVPDHVRQEIHLDVRRTVRSIAFCNPQLARIDKLLLIERHDSGGVFHMCDQYYGCNARPGGGLFVLENPFSDRPKLVNLLENAVVENGRLKGQKLEGGSFLSPEVSFDGKTILFAYSQCQAKKTYQWAPEFSHHIFKVNADGTGLVQLTDGPADDFDPCFLPGGRIVFVSERRGGYLRCGRHCPVYTMFSMEPDGSDVICISFHETHEWHPSVTNEGMLVYSRWDYVDRDTNIAHHIWTCYADGRDPRSFHGNYPVRRESRPWMEMSIRAIPDSNKFVAVTGAHHGQAFGSLVLIDPRIEDDRAASQLTRLTPEVPFPEAEGRPIPKYMIYGTPWPLSEDDYLCAYDPNVKNRGIYWIDADGNKELIYRDPAISCLSPIPLQARRRPPVLPDRTTQTAAARKAAGGDRPATVSVMNVYESDFQWPAGTTITDLRVIQLLPKSTAPPNQPRIGVANQTNARAVLGTVPVEADGSAHFEAPVGVPIYFQALDADGTAVQSMRSLTYVHPGEQLTCHGCHERKHRPPTDVATLPLALKRTPSKLQRDVDGSNPFNYVRLVQPVLDRHCVACHQQKKAIDLAGTPEGAFTRSYNALAGKYGFYFHVTNGSINQGVHGGSRTIAGKFGAKASELLKYMDERHYNVKLSPEDRHRLTLWLDCNSEFLGSYENVAAQLRGEVVQPTLE